ncbi:glycosyltransferase family 25 protein [Arcobacter sp.]|uniref:glycosyltransferase family 25 protein n=1 Tax=unclassified Arcobacter TaxID=2593671 RepID=UPI003AFFA89B
MEIFVINLKKDIERRVYMLNLLKKYNLDFELITAIEGKKLKDVDIIIGKRKFNAETISNTLV